MDDIKNTYRDAEQDANEAIRGRDGTDLKDHGGNIGDELRKDLGNLGDDIREGADRTFPNVEPSDKTF